jgi:hypothetical protein
MSGISDETMKGKSSILVTRRGVKTLIRDDDDDDEFSI